MREPPNIPEESLRACLQGQYNLTPTTLEFLPLGLDYNAGVYRVVSNQTSYLLKVKSGPLYEPAYLVPRYLNDQGITSVVAPLPTSSNALWTHLEDWTLIVYPFIDGDTNWTGMTDAHWQNIGTTFKRIHQLTPPPSGFPSIRKETFDPTEYAQLVYTIETQHILSHHDGGPSERALRSSWLAHQSTIHNAATLLQKLAEQLQSRTFPYVICHADLHANNLIRDRAGHVFVIDWDDVMLAPKERDFIFIRQPQAKAFFQGYGAAEIDWMLLSYYLWERVMQDVIYIAQNVYSRHDWAEETRAEVAQGFHEYLTEGSSNLTAAYEASAHLPPDLTLC